MATIFNDYLSKYASTEIPLIQRDYVQGADYWSSKRNDFVKALLAALHSGKSEALNFIYGISHNHRFIPLDGQQRLTSLNLLGWLLLQAVRLTYKDDFDSSWRGGLSLSYQTRASSQEFCDHLLKSDLGNFTEKPSKQIKESLWFAESWTHDPTIVAMLEMSDYLWQEFKPYEQDWPRMARRFFTDSPIEFELLELQNRDPDDLYIKINARGKALTEFEHWKAWFIGKLSSDETLKKEFEDKIETDWCNFFWEFANKDADDIDYPRIDEYFMRFFAFVTDILCAFANPDGMLYSAHVEDRADDAARKVVEEIYFAPNGGVANLRLLFSLLDTLPRIGNLARYLYSAKDPKDPQITEEKEKVNIFGEADNLDLLSSLLNGDNIDLRPRFLLWGVIRHVALHSKGRLQDFILIWWGVLMNIRQRNADGFEVNSNVRWNRLHEWKDTLDTILKDADPFANAAQLNAKGALASWVKYNSPNFHANNGGRYSEDIVRLQNHPWLLYDVHVLDDLINDRSIPAGDVFDRFNTQFVALPNKERAKPLLEHGFSGCKPKSGYLTYGLTDNWAYIFTDDASPAAAPLCEYLKGSAPAAPTKWPSDFIYKYYDVLKHMPENRAFHVDANRGILFGSKKSLSKRGYIMEPYDYVTTILAGYTMANGEAAVTYDTSHREDKISLFTVDSTHWGICFQAYKLQMEPVKGGWILSSYDDGADPDVLSPTAQFTSRFGASGAWTDTQGAFSISPDGYVAKLPGKDRVETGVELLKAIIALL